MTKIEVTQADRDAAEESIFYQCGNQHVKADIQMSFARHRIAVTAEKDAEIARLREALKKAASALEHTHFGGDAKAARAALGETK